MMIAKSMVFNKLMASSIFFCRMKQTPPNIPTNMNARASGIAGINRKICDPEVLVGATVNAWKANKIDSKYIKRHFH